MSAYIHCRMYLIYTVLKTTPRLGHAYISQQIDSSSVQVMANLPVNEQQK